MANVGDDIVSNILIRLPGKALLRFRSVSKHWNGLISDPYFMKSRSRRMILLTLPRHRLVIDDNVPVEDKAHSMVRIHGTLEEHGGVVSIVGTFNGIVLLALNNFHGSLRCCSLILYNPLTRASNKVLDMDIPCSYTHHSKPFVFGFGDEFKIVRFETSYNSNMYKWDVFDPKTSSWSGQPRYLKIDFVFWGDACMFLNGFLHWKTYSPSIDNGSFGILALDVKEMVISRIELPFQFQRIGDLLGSVDGCLCMLSTFNVPTFELWVRKEQGVEISWLKAHSFTLGLEPFNEWRHVRILGNGKILFTTRKTLLVIYDTSKDSYETFPCYEASDYLNAEVFALLSRDIQSMEYVESLVSPFDSCFN